MGCGGGGSEGISREERLRNQRTNYNIETAISSGVGVVIGLGLANIVENHFGIQKEETKTLIDIASSIFFGYSTFRVYEHFGGLLRQRRLDEYLNNPDNYKRQ